jgi:hypothetical protein
MLRSSLDVVIYAVGRSTEEVQPRYLQQFMLPTQFVDVPVGTNTTCHRHEKEIVNQKPFRCRVIFQSPVDITETVGVLWCTELVGVRWLEVRAQQPANLSSHSSYMFDIRTDRKTLPVSQQKRYVYRLLSSDRSVKLLSSDEVDFSVSTLRNSARGVPSSSVLDRRRENASPRSSSCRRK